MIKQYLSVLLNITSVLLQNFFSTGYLQMPLERKYIFLTLTLYLNREGILISIKQWKKLYMGENFGKS